MSLPSLIRRFALGLAMLTLGAVLHPAGAAAASPPQVAFAVGSPSMQAAQALARAHWHMDPCGGHVDLRWTVLDDDINAVSTWSNPRSSYGDPQENSDCSIDFNTHVPFDWPMFCTVVVHEYGHLSGQPHSHDPDDVMAPIYNEPVAECDTAGPGTAAVAATTPAAPRVTKVVKPAAVRKKAKAKRRPGARSKARAQRAQHRHARHHRRG